MKGLLRSKLFVSLAAFIMAAATVVLPLSSSITHLFAATGRSSHNIAYVNYNDSGFTGSSIPSANIFTDAIVGGPSPTSSPTDSVTYNGMTFTPLARAAISPTTLANYDTLILFEVCDIATSLSASQHDAINAYLAAGNKIILFDGDRCAPSAGGNADYSWFQFPFKTSNPGPQGASGTLTIVENSTLTNGLSADPFNLDELGDANTATTADPHWFAAAKTTNALGNNGYFLAYARNSGLIIYDGADHWATDGPTKSLTDLFLNELNQQYNPDNLPGTTPIGGKHQTLFVFIQGLTSKLTEDQINDTKEGLFGDFQQIFSTIQNTKGFVNARDLFFSYTGSTSTGTPLPYACEDTVKSPKQFAKLDPIVAYVKLLDAQITNALNGHPNTDVYIIGHSLGGVVAYAYLTSFIEHLGVSLPQGQGDQLKGVFTLDSPLGGIPNNTAYLKQAVNVFDNQCGPLSKRVSTGRGGGHRVQLIPLLPLDDLVKIHGTTSKTPTPEAPKDPGPDPLGARAGIGLTLLGGSNMSNEQIAEAASAQGISVLTVGNTDDLLFNPSLCNLPHVFDFPKFVGTQYIEDEGHASGAYGRKFTSGEPFPCVQGGFSGGNHGAVLSNGDVQLGIMEVLLGLSPTSLKSGVNDQPGPQ